MKSLEWQVNDIASPMRIDRVLAEKCESFSRSRLQQLLQEGFVLLNDTTVKKASEKVHQGDRILIRLPPPQPSSALPENIPIERIYEDEDLMVINKAAGISVHPTEHMKQGTLVNALLHHIRDLSGIGGVLRPGIVHRLDRGTSGVLIIAKNDEFHQKLSEAFKERTIRKTYWALVHGVPPSLKGEIDRPIGRHPSDRKRMNVRDDGRNSRTEYKICGRGLGGSWLELYPKTGRTHQIRVHLNHIGCPVVGDTLYCTRRYKGKGELERIFKEYPGFALHARAIEFEHPKSGKRMFFEATPPPLFTYVIERMDHE